MHIVHLNGNDIGINLNRYTELLFIELFIRNYKRIYLNFPCSGYGLLL